MPQLTQAQRRARQDRVNRVAAAVKDGRIPPERRAFWLARLRENPAAAEALDAITPVRASQPGLPRWPE
ncbi:hypothetical protein [Prescottella equi]|uniref:hypothetical protein n=1 Tax=Rhodococcus hoagii TaxID=43767 RepID=UPI00384C74FE